MRFLIQIAYIFGYVSIPLITHFCATLYIPFTSLSLSFISPSLPLYISPYTFLSPSLSLLSIILFGVSNGRFRPCLCYILAYISYLFNVRVPIEKKPSTTRSIWNCVAQMMCCRVNIAIPGSKVKASNSDYIIYNKRKTWQNVVMKIKYILKQKF